MANTSIGMATDGEDVDIAAVRSQLQMERAHLAQEIGSRMNSLSPTKKPNGSSSRVNPFTMGSSDAGQPQFHHRPATLGLGATPPSVNEKDSVQDRRLKGVLSGKRKQPDTDMSTMRKEDTSEDETDTRMSQVRDTASKKGPKKDPFASKSGKNTQSKAPSSSAQLADAAGEQTIDLQGLSKSARKKMKKRLRQASQSGAEGAGEGLSIRKEGEQKDQKEHLEHLEHNKRPRHQNEDDGSIARSGKKNGRDALTSADRNADHGAVDNSSLNRNGDNGTVEKSPLNRKGDHGAVDMSPLNSMTPHQRAMHSQLAGARFRQINEKLYTTSSEEALAMVAENPGTLQDYHEGFREQVKSWPQVPVRQIFEDLEKAQQAALHKLGTKMKSRPVGRNVPGAVIADLGAGDGFLAKWFATSKAMKHAPVRPRVLSYDLLNSSDGWVRGLDIARTGGLPLPGRDTSEEDSSQVVDVAVFCLALMATNWIESILEAGRVLRLGGELIIAEVSSRITDRKAFIDVIQKTGFQLIHQDTSNTHFVRYDFAKVPSPVGDRLALQEQGAKLLKPCIYKRR